jgi:hypothetical protein
MLWQKLTETPPTAPITVKGIDHMISRGVATATD